MFLRFGFLVGLTLAYDHAALSSLEELASQTNSTNTAINSLNDCDFSTTTQAISNKTKLVEGSACPSADITIANLITSLTQSHNNTIASLQTSRADSQVSSAEILAAYKPYAKAFYALFNALDLAECAFILTPQSRSFPAQFDPHAGVKVAHNRLVSELRHDFVVALKISGSELAQQTHFAGTKFLATQVGGPRLTALAGCKLITAIVESEGGGRN